MKNTGSKQRQETGESKSTTQFTIIHSKEDYDAVFKRKTTSHNHPTPIHSVHLIRLYYLMQILLLGIPWLIGYRLNTVRQGESGVIQNLTSQKILNDTSDVGLYRNLSPGVYITGPNKKLYKRYQSLTAGEAGRVNINESPVVGIANTSQTGNIIVPLAPNQDFSNQSGIDYQDIKIGDIYSLEDQDNQISAENMIINPGLFIIPPGHKIVKNSVVVDTECIAVVFQNGSELGIDGIHKVAMTDMTDGYKLIKPQPHTAHTPAEALPIAKIEATDPHTIIHLADAEEKRGHLPSSLGADTVQQYTVGPGTYVVSPGSKMVTIVNTDTTQDIEVKFSDLQLREFKGMRYNGTCALTYQIVNPAIYVRKMLNEVHHDKMSDGDSHHTLSGKDQLKLIENEISSLILDAISSLSIRNVTGQISELTSSAGEVEFNTGTHSIIAQFNKIYAQQIGVWITSASFTECTPTAESASQQQELLDRSRENQRIILDSQYQAEQANAMGTATEAKLAAKLVNINCDKQTTIAIQEQRTAEAEAELATELVRIDCDKQEQAARQELLEAQLGTLSKEAKVAELSATIADSRALAETAATRAEQQSSVTTGIAQINAEVAIANARAKQSVPSTLVMTTSETLQGGLCGPSVIANLLGRTQLTSTLDGAPRVAGESPLKAMPSGLEAKV